MRDYKKFTVWTRSHELTMTVYKEIAPCFPESENDGLARQLRA